jgi:hypothetical protein
VDDVDDRGRSAVVGRFLHRAGEMRAPGKPGG